MKGGKQSTRRRFSPVTVVENQPPSKFSEGLPFVDRVADKVRTLAAVKPALVRLLEWQIETEIELAQEQRDGSRTTHGST
jgi:hypothetical protein